MIGLLNDECICIVVTEEKLRPRMEKICKNLRVALKHLVFDFEDPIKDKEPDFQPKE